MEPERQALVLVVAPVGWLVAVHTVAVLGKAAAQELELVGLEHCIVAVAGTVAAAVDTAVVEPEHREPFGMQHSGGTAEPELELGRAAVPVLDLVRSESS